MRKLFVKICGITNEKDAIEAIRLGADHIGFIFAQSPRQVTQEEVKKIVGSLVSKDLLQTTKIVGVFVNEDMQRIEEIYHDTGIDLVQLHGDETSEFAQSLSVPWYKALRFSSTEEVDLFLSSQRELWSCDTLLIDTAVKGHYGGTGITMAYDLAKYATQAIQKMGKKCILAGGLNPENIGTMIKKSFPDGVDVSSGVEKQRGIKSFVKLQRLFEEINSATKQD